MSSSSRRSRSRRAGGSLSSSSSMSISEEQISDLLSKLQALLPDSSQAARSGAHRGSASRVLQETCSYIRSLHREVDDLSETLATLLGSDAVTADQAALIRSLLLM